MEKQEILLESGTNEVELLTFIIGNQVFGVNVAKIQSIIKFEAESVTEIPMAHSAVLGMMLFRDHTVPLIDLARALDMPDNEERAKAIVIVMEFNNSVNSFLIDGVNRIHRVSWDKFVPINEMISNFGNTNVTGSIHIDDDEIIIVDMEGILVDISPELAIEEVTEETLLRIEKEKRGGVRIFFAEDSKVIRENVLRVLEQTGYTNITGFIDGKIAFDEFQRIKGDPDKIPHILVSDIEMPEMDGLTLCKNVKADKDLKNVKVIMFSSLINDQMIKKCKSVDADNYVTKPEVNKLVGMLDEVLI